MVLTLLFPFEAILSPDRYFPATASGDFRDESEVENFGVGYRNARTYFTYPHFTGSLKATANPNFADPWSAQAQTSTAAGTKQEIFFYWQGESDVKYSLAANNFFAEVENFSWKTDHQPHLCQSQEKISDQWCLDRCT